MTDKPDPAKDAGRSDSPGVKRPHATLDLKATEVRPSSSQQPAAANASASAAAGAPSAGGTKPAGPTEPAGKSPPPGGTAPKAAPAAPAGAKPGGGPKAGGLISHLAAGVLGGGLVYAGTALLGPTDPGDLAARVAALETAAKDGGADALAARIGDAEGRLAKLDQLEQSLAAVRDETRTLAEAARSGTESAERLKKVEEQLAMIAAGAEGAEGRVPQLAAITGKISDLERSLASEVAALRKSLPAEADARLGDATEAVARLDRELAQLRTEQARGSQKAESAKADAERLAAAVEAVREEAGKLSSAVGALRSSVDSELKSVAKAADVTAAVAPVADKLAKLEENVQGVVKSEESRRQNAERIVLALELSKLKRALDRGQGHGYATELAEVQKAAGGTLDLSALERFKDTGVATPAELKAAFRPVMNAVIDADLEPADGSVIDRLMAGAKSVVRVRRISHDASDTSTEAVVARIEAALDEGRLGDVIAQANTLSPRARAPIEDWLIKVTARHSVDQALAAVEDRLKAALSGAPEAEDAPAAAPAPVQN